MIPSKHAGDRAEAAVIQAVEELEMVPDDEDEHVDARLVATIDPDESLRTIALPVLEQGTLVEIKSCSVVITKDQSRGRFYLRRKQHEYLREQGAVYLFAVCEPRPQRSIIGLKAAAATSVDDVVPSWRDPGDGRPVCAQIAWSKTFDEEEIGGGSDGA